MWFKYLIPIHLLYTPPSSRGLGHLPFTEATGIRIPLGVPFKLQSQSQISGSGAFEFSGESNKMIQRMPKLRQKFDMPKFHLLKLDFFPLKKPLQNLE